MGRRCITFTPDASLPPRDVRKLIRRTFHGEKLNEIHQRAIVARPGQVAVPREIEFWLTEAQALKVVARSETEIADALLEEMIRIYMLARRGLLPDQQHLAELNRGLGGRRSPIDRTPSVGASSRAR